jgi:uncharacterized SAM-binding protein YcdF (DUF218 family)
MSTTTQRASHRGASAGRPDQHGGRLSTLLKVTSISIAFVLAAFLLIAGNVVASARAYETTRTDAIVVLGAAQYWSEPSPVFSNRLDHAVDLYQQGVAPTIVTVGGGIPGDKTTEAEAGATYLEQQGIPKSAIAVIPKGSDTIESLEAVASQSQSLGWHSLAIVSDRAHVARSAAVAEGLGFTTTVSGPAAGDGSLLTFERVGWETLGLARFYLWDRWLLDK